MPSNEIKINGSNDLTWDVGDSKMDGLIAYLDRIAPREVKKPPIIDWKMAGTYEYEKDSYPL